MIMCSVQGIAFCLVWCSDLFILKNSGLNWGSFDSQGDIWQCLETILAVTTAGIFITRIDCIEAKDAAKSPAVHRAFHHIEESSSPK